MARWRVSDTVSNQSTGLPIPSATIVVRDFGGSVPTATTLYANATGGTLFGGTTDAAGGFQFWVDAPARFDVVISAPGFGSATITREALPDPGDVIRTSGTQTRGTGLTLTSPTINTPAVTGGTWVGATFTNPSFAGGSWSNATLTNASVGAASLTVAGAASLNTAAVSGQTELRGKVAIGDAAAGQAEYDITQYQQNQSTSLISLGVGLDNVGTSGIESGGIQSFVRDMGHGQIQGINSHIEKNYSASTAAHVAAGTGDGWRNHPFESSLAIRLGVLSDDGDASWSGTNDTRYGHGYGYFFAHFSAATQAYPWYEDGAWIVTPPGSGTYTLTVDPDGPSGPFTTSAIAFNASAATVEAALEALPGMVAANVEVKVYGSVLRVILRNMGINSNLLTGTGATVQYHGQGDAANTVLYSGGTDGTENFLYDQALSGLTDRPYMHFISIDPTAVAGAKDKAFLGIGGIVPAYPFHLFSRYRADDGVMSMIQQIHTTASMTPVHQRWADEADVDEFFAAGYNTTLNVGVLQAVDNGVMVPILIGPSGGKVGVGTGTTLPTGQHEVWSSAAGVIPQVTRGFSGQTAALQQWQNNAGTALANMGALGHFSTAARITAGQASDGPSGIIYAKQSSAGIGGGIVLAEFGSNGHTGNFYQDANDFYFQFVGAGTRYFQFKGATDEIYTPSVLNSNTAFHVQSQKVVGVRGAAVAAVAGAVTVPLAGAFSSAADRDTFVATVTEIKTQLNALLTRLRVTGGHGLIAD